MRPWWFRGRQATALLPQNWETARPAKFATQMLSLPSTTTPHGTRRPPPVMGNGVRFPSIIVRLPSRVGVSAGSGQGMPMTREFATHAVPEESTATPRGFSRPAPPIAGPIGVPEASSTATVSLPLPVTNTRPSAPSARAKGLVTPRSVRLRAAAGFPPG